jgi:serine/threonine-protein kinase RIO1
MVTTNTDTFLSSVHKLFLFFDYSLIDLQQEIKNRKIKNIKFLEKDIWNMINGLSHAINYFHHNKIFLNNL